jgi:hypothetical protein
MYQQVLEVDRLYTDTNKFIVVLDSRNAAVKSNGDYTSDVTFHFEDPIHIPRDSLKMSCSVMTFTAPNSIYNVNETNNKFSIQLVNTTTGYTGTTYTGTIPKGNYNANTFITQFLASTAAIPFSMTFNSVTNKFTLVLTSPVVTQFSTLSDFTFTAASTIGDVMGFTSPPTSASSTLVFPYMCNFNGVQNINIHFDNLNTENLDSLTSSSSNIIQSIPIDPNACQISFLKTNDYSFTIRQDVIDNIKIQIQDDLGNFINFNGKHWNMTLYFTFVKDIDRFQHEKSFSYILQNGYS